MRRVIVTALFAATLAVPRSASAQSWGPFTAGWGSGWCPNCYTVGNIDIPNAGSPYAGYFAGWAFRCEAGEPTTRFDVYYTGTDGVMKRSTNYTLFAGLERPDVYAYGSGGGTFGVKGGPNVADATFQCPRTPANTGWAIVPHDIPPGTYSITIVFWYGWVSSSQTGTITVQ